MKTSEKDCPSLSNVKKANALPFVPIADMYRMSTSWFNVNSATYGGYNSKRKLTLPERQQLQTLFKDVSYSRGATLQELDLSDNLSCTDILEHNCYDPVEPLYYVAGFDPICVYCESEEVTAVKTKIPSSACRLRTGCNLYTL